MCSAHTFFFFMLIQVSKDGKHYSASQSLFWSIKHLEWWSLSVHHSSLFIFREDWAKKKGRGLHEKPPSGIPQGLSQWLWWKQEKHLTSPMVTSPVFQEFMFQNCLFPNLFHLPSQEKKCSMGHQSSLPTPNTLTLSWKYQRRILYMRSHHLVSKGSGLLSAQSHPPFLSCSQERPFSSTAGCVMLKLEYPISL